MAEKKDDCVESPISPCTVEEKAGDGNEEVSPCLDEVSSSSSSSSRDNIPEFAYPASWEAVGLESPLGEESAEEEAEALEEQEEDYWKEAEDEVDDIQLDLYFHQMEFFAAEQEVQEAASSSRGPEVPVSDDGSVPAPSTVPVATAAADPYTLPDQEWTAEDWEIWRDVLVHSGPNKGQKRRLEMFRRFKYLREQGEWIGSTPDDRAKSARLAARPKSAGGKPS